MRRSSILIFATLLLGLSATGAGADHHDPVAAHTETDRNSDGVVDRGEYYMRMVEIFYLSDANRDGYLVLVEIGRVGRGDFDSADANSDGKLSLNEYVDARFDEFDTIDSDRNGLITKPEAQAAR